MVVANTGALRRDKSQDRLWPGVWVGLVALAVVGLPVSLSFFLLVAIVGATFVELIGLEDPGRVSQMESLPSLSWLAEAALLICLPFALSAINNLVGWKIVALVIFATFVADILALYGGRRFGHHKLAARISPGKTVEGVAFGLLGALVVAAILKPAIGLSISWPLLLGSTTIFILASVLGDLNESSLKRKAGVKDSGKILRGHGGILDRIDALLIAAVAAIVLVAVGWL